MGPQWRSSCAAGGTLELLFASVTVWPIAALGFGLLEFFDAMEDYSVGRMRAGGREPWLLGAPDFRRALVLWRWRSRWRPSRWGRCPPGATLGVAAGVAGAVGLVLSGAVAGVLGLGLGRSSKASSRCAGAACRSRAQPVRRIVTAYVGIGFV